MSLAQTYDLVPYPSCSYPQSHPDRLATVARLFGMDPAPVENCRVLELGCANGGNLIPMAACLPGSEFVGIDDSSRHIATAQEAAASLGLDNLRLKKMDIRDVRPDFGLFDYIIAHGVYSWVPPDVQSKILAICKQNLAPNGVALVSYGTYPGSHPRRALREMMQYHTRDIADPYDRAAQARALVSFLDDSIRGLNHGYSAMLMEERQRIQAKQDAFLLHNDLEEENHPVYYYEFMERATRERLQFLEEADIHTSLFSSYSAEVLESIIESPDDIVRREQYLDFLSNRPFRETLLCHDEIELRRVIGPEHLRPFLFAARSECVLPQPGSRSAPVASFHVPHDAVATSQSDPALQYLAQSWPRAASLDELVAATDARYHPDAEAAQVDRKHDGDIAGMLESLWQAFAMNLIELHVHAPSLVTQPSDRPLAPAFARYQAKNGTSVTNLRHEVVHLDELTRHLLLHLDGTHDGIGLVGVLKNLVKDRGMIVQQYGEPITESDAMERVLAEGLDAKLRALAYSALLVG